MDTPALLPARLQCPVCDHRWSARLPRASRKRSTEALDAERLLEAQSLLHQLDARYAGVTFLDLDDQHALSHYRETYAWFAPAARSLQAVLERRRADWEHEPPPTEHAA